MTLILALANRDYTIQLSDRRLTSVQGVVTDDAGKAGILSCEDARLAFGFAGLARAGGFRTQQWLLDAVLDSLAPEYHAQPIMERLRKRLTREFNTNLSIRSALPAQRCLSVLFSGYLYRAEPPLLMQSLITNFQDIESEEDNSEAWDEFKCYYFNEKRSIDHEFTLIQRIGMWPAFPDNDPTLRRMLQERKPARAVIGKALELFETAARHPRAGGTIGRRISAITLSSDYAQPPDTRYYSDVNSSTIYFPDQVITESDSGAYAIMSPELTELPSPDGRQGVLVVPKVGRNAPCPCQSGKKYKKCHGQTHARGWAIELNAEP